MSLVGFGAILYASMYFHFKRENASRAQGKRDAKIQGLSEDEIVALGDENPRFKLAA